MWYLPMYLCGSLGKTRKSAQNIRHLKHDKSELFKKGDFLRAGVIDMQKTELDWKKSSDLTLPFKLSKHQLKTQVLFKVLLFRDKQILPPTGLTTLSMISNIWKETANLDRKLLF